VEDTPAAGISISAGQATYFADTKVRDADGNLIKLYHGSAHEFNAFDPKTLGRGNDAWGNGFYFTDQESVAQGYANDSPSPTANVKEFYLNLKNPIEVDGKEHMSLTDYEFTQDQVLSILKKHPDIYKQPGEDDDNPNPLEDYSAEFWDKEEWTKEELDRMIAKVARENFEYGNWVSLESFYGREHGAAYLQSVHEATGHDGVIVDFGEDVGKHYVAWFPHQMKLTSNTEPTDSDQF
jgi:hypothetical protein